MYEDSKTLDKTQESDEESYSYPSYSRFTFTGKPKSRLGRNNKQARLTVRKNDIKEDKVTNSGDTCGGETSATLSYQAPKTPGINWLSGDASSLTNPFTAGINIFTASKNVPDSHQPNKTGSEIDISSSSVSSQLNFFSTLKNDSAQISNCSRNFTFNKTPFRGIGSCDRNLLNEQNHHLTKTPILKLDFSCNKKEENKENTERKLNHFKNKENSLDPSWNQLRKVSDSAVLCPSAKLSENGNFVSGCNKNNFGRTTNESFRSNVFPLMSVFDRTSDTMKDDDDSTNTPLDLSSGDSLSNKIIFNKSAATGSDQSYETVVSSGGHVVQKTEQETNKIILNKSATGSDQYYGTVVSLGGNVAQKTEQDKYYSDKDSQDTKQKDSLDAIDSILPIFMAPINKIKSKEFDADGKSNGKYVATSSYVKHSNHEFKTKQSVLFDELPNPFVVPGASMSNSQVSFNKSGNVSEKQIDSKKDIDKDCQQLSQQKSFYQPQVIKENVCDNISIKNASHLNLVQPVQSTTENKSDTLVSCHNDKPVSSDKEHINFQIDCLPNSSTTSKLTSIAVTERNIAIGPNQVTEVEQNQNTLANINNNTSKEETKTLNSNSVKTSTVQMESPPITEMSEKMSLIDNQLEKPISSEIMPAQNSLSVSSMRSNFINNTSKPVQTDIKPPESNPQEPPCSQPQIFPNNIQKVEGNLHHNVAKSQTYEELKIQLPQMKVIECSENHVKQYPVQQHYMPIQKQASENPVSMGFTQQKTYLAPHNPTDKKFSNKNCPYKKPEVPQQISNRPSFAMMDKPKNNYKMPPPQGRLHRANSELFVNGKVYTILSILGRGGSSEVYQVLDPRSSKLLAVKCVDLSMVDKTIADGYLNEIDLLSKLQGCSSVIKMFDYEYVQEYKMLYVVLEKGDTDLSQLIRDISKTKKISMSMIIYYWTEMLTAVRDIHEQGIIHSDLKPANFLLVSGRLKLIDFGIASSQGDMTSVVKEVTTGTWNYMSPEAIRNTSTSGKGFKITYKSDVWSLGCILYNLVYGKTPFSHITNTWGKLQAIADSSHQIDFPDVGTPLVLGQALRSCFHRDPKLRPTAAELLSLPYHATYDTSHIGRQLHLILPQEWWHKVAHLFPEMKSEEKSEVPENKCTGSKADLT